MRRGLPGASAGVAEGGSVVSVGGVAVPLSPAVGTATMQLVLGQPPHCGDAPPPPAVAPAPPDSPAGAQ